MTAGTDGFIGARLREAREARGVTATALAQALGVKPAAVSRYESDAISPRPELTLSLCRVLGVPPHFFLRPTEQSQGSAVFYRSLSSATKTARVSGERHLLWAHEMISGYLTTFVDLPPTALPRLAVPRDPLQLSDDDIEGLAADARQHFRLHSAPIVNMTWLMESVGVIVIRAELLSDKLDSFSQWLDGRPYMVISAQRGSTVRYNFDLAHELGHLLLHAHVDEARVFKSPEHKVLEEQANRFAGAFLLPSDAFTRDVFATTLGAFRSLKSKWHASIGVMISRARDLRMITDREENWLWMQYGRKGWRRWEPLDDELEIPEPQLLRKSFELLVDHRIQTRADILAQIPMTAEDIEHLAGLPAGFLKQSDALPVRLKVDVTTGPSDRSEDQIVQFPGRAPWTV